MRWQTIDNPPDEEITVLVHAPNCDEPVQPGFLSGGAWHDYNGAEIQVTHWMHFPDPPSETEVTK